MAKTKQCSQLVLRIAPAVAEIEAKTLGECKSEHSRIIKPFKGLASG